jgi:predicted DNA-binding protein
MSYIAVIPLCNTYKYTSNATKTMTGSLSIRIPEETKKKMAELDVDWPAYIRRAIEEKIDEIKRKKAAESMDRIRAKTKRGAFDSARSIREDRNG